MATPKETVSSPQTVEVKGLNNNNGGGKKTFNIVITVVIIVLIALFAWSEKGRRDQARQLKQASQKLNELTSSNQKRMEEVEKEILGKVRNHVELPDDPKPVVLTVLDAEKLKKDNPFYEKAENGDHLIVTAKWAVLYSPARDKVYGASSVTPEQANQAKTNGNEAANASPVASVSPKANP